MEKTTKKKKKTKSLRRRIGIIAVGGLSLVMTVCLSIGATLAWFAGSTWSDSNLYMGGPVYVEMAGRGTSAETNGGAENSGKAVWQGGTGSLDIKASAARSSGTAYSKATAAGTGPNNEEYAIGDYLDAMGNKISDDAAANIDRNVLLPGQKFEIYSQARVYSTATTSSIADSDTASNSSGANVTNKSSTGMAYHRTNDGRITTTTTSVLRARFSISVEFDPSVGFGNFTNTSYMTHYPVQSSAYTGDGVDTDGQDNSWAAALVDNTGAVAGEEEVFKTTNTVSNGVGSTVHTGRRDFVDNKSLTIKYTNETDVQADLEAIQEGTKKSVYSWKYVSKATYDSETLTTDTEPTAAAPCSQMYMKMGYPFNGEDKSTNSNGYYGVWILNQIPAGQTNAGKYNGIAESDSFYKARCNAYLQTYVEEFQSEYGNIEKKTIADSILSLESALNQSFVNLVNDSSDDIHAGFTQGFTVSPTTGEMLPVMTDNNGTTVNDKTLVGTNHKHNASWLYIDPKIGNDTNTNEISTSTGGWWYLVADDGGSVATGTSEVTAVTDSVEFTGGKWMTKGASPVEAKSNDPNTAAASFKRELDDNLGINSTNTQRLTAKLYEIKPNAKVLEEIGMNKTTAIHKIVSPAFPFVNGSAALPGDALTNVFANAKISFQISFQALQAFFPFSTNIDKIDYKNPLLGTAKALNIANAIPIFNEAFDYQETGITSSAIEGL